jgi:protein SCO1/2
MTRLFARAAILAVCSLIAVTVWAAFSSRSGDPFAKCRSSQVSGGPGSIGGPFTLVDQTGATVTEAQVLDQPALVYFGYTYCPDVCPLDMARNVEAVDILEERGIDVKPVFISVDPRRDTPEQLASFAENLHPRMVALSGTDEQVRNAAATYKAYFKVNEGDPDSYLVDHSTFTYLMMPGTGFVDFFRREATADDIADAVSCFAEAA